MLRSLDPDVKVSGKVQSTAEEAHSLLSRPSVLLFCNRARQEECANIFVNDLIQARVDTVLLCFLF